MLFKPKKEEFEFVREGDENILKGNYDSYTRVPSLEDDELCMARVVEELIRNPSTNKIVFFQKHDYEYDASQTKVLSEIAQLYSQLIKNKDLLSYQALSQNRLVDKYNEIHNLVYNILKKDPVGFYVELKRLIRKQKISLDKVLNKEEETPTRKYLAILEYLAKKMEETQLVELTKPYLAGYEVGRREIYKKIFNPVIKPDFMYTKLMAAYPKNAQQLLSYNVGRTEVVVFDVPGNIQYLYHITPPEFKLSEEQYEILDTARKIMAEHQPEKQEFVDPERIREVFYNVGRDLIEELVNYRKANLKPDDIDFMTEILVRYTVGFGLIEILLQDQGIQDITVNSPLGTNPIFIVHEKFGECRTNIVPTISDSESWASKLRMISGRPLDEANPILDTELIIPGIAAARVAAIAEPLNPSGIAFAFRRHRDKPWTLPLFIKNRMLTPLAAGIISFLIDGNRTLLVAGTRSAGKTSLLGAIMVEIMRKYRVITIEDTLELPVKPLRSLGYNIQPMKVASALSKEGVEVPADQGIRTTLRMGDSSLIIGEVRSTEAKALYEAMRVGALANVVAGTIHGDSPYGVFDRVVNDLGVPRTSFKATDIIIVCNPVKSAGGLQKWRRVTEITEVRKLWEEDPLKEQGFVDLMKYNPKKDELEPTDELVTGDSEILKAIAGNVRDWAGNWDAVWENIQLRAKMKEALVDYSDKLKKPELIEAPFVILANDEFHKISENIKIKTGSINNKQIFFEWKEWINNEIRKIDMENEHG